MNTCELQGEELADISVCGGGDGGERQTAEEKHGLLFLQKYPDSPAPSSTSPGLNTCV